MTISILFVQGGGAGAHDRWDHELLESLERELGSDYCVRYPRMPNEDRPRYSDWKAALLDQFKSLEEGAILLGHSVGGTALLHLLSEERPKLKPGAIILIAAPYIGEGGWPGDDDMQERTDYAERLPAGVPIFLYHGAKDPIVPFGHVFLYARAIPQAMVRGFANRDHQLNDDLSDVARDIRSLSPGFR